jgi:hypothetical protein
MCNQQQQQQQIKTKKSGVSTTKPLILSINLVFAFVSACFVMKRQGGGGEVEPILMTAKNADADTDTVRWLVSDWSLKLCLRSCPAV